MQSQSQSRHPPCRRQAALSTDEPNVAKPVSSAFGEVRQCSTASHALAMTLMFCACSSIAAVQPGTKVLVEDVDDGIQKA